MHHIEIYVKNLEVTRAFYSKLLEVLNYELYQNWELGFSYKKNGFYIVFVQVRDKYIDNGYNRCNIGLNHLAFKCSSKRKIDEIRDILMEENVNLLYDEKYPYAGGESHYALYFEDPDRIKLEIVFCEEE
ncbi:VOC family protein [Macrococcus sp. DPC7161]|uniref:VOC family protein n=1 Tax=Macrococcus sp. DPC7161 TaxID=2507060 RepID=UPI00100B6626|nr:VOC family protein [Macrococcus sp. DPC7161]RXK17510.1 hypothetical protein ER639_10240 [Macrococcus sp. DPC7161]